MESLSMLKNNLMLKGIWWMMLLKIWYTSNPWNYKTTTTEMPEQTYLKFYRMMATDMLFIIWIQMWEVNERTIDKNEGGRNNFFPE